MLIELPLGLLFLLTVFFLHELGNMLFPLAWQQKKEGKQLSIKSCFQRSYTMVSKGTNTSMKVVFVHRRQPLNM